MKTMGPQAFASLFVGSMGASAALVGLLFVAVSIKPERITARGAPPEPQAVASSAFTALANAFFISLGGSVPGLNLGSVALWASLISLAETLNLGRKLWRGRPGPLRMVRMMRRLALVALSVFIYGLQLRYALQLLVTPRQLGALYGLVYLLFAVYAIGLGRSWELLGARREGPLACWLSPLQDVAEAAPSATEAGSTQTAAN
jgi:hypothetical protein